MPTTKRIRVKDVLTYGMKGAATLEEALRRDLHAKYGDDIEIEFYFGLAPHGRPISEISGKLVLGEPDVALIAKVTIPDGGAS